MKKYYNVIAIFHKMAHFLLCDGHHPGNLGNHFYWA